ncbi:hypothetical protein BKH20_03150 [Actinomyces oris]|uniref:Transposase IS110-like N-terminal domain-containing protein n=1 Tax=Actinomyces oris TaxID=544580 RepID=A0A1Q8WVJ9_9ACTO|nr:transposase [Actinomyces oris]OLO72064.1 hypothetical protein BKH20_03150 [Actinomyces oris]
MDIEDIEVFIGIDVGKTDHWATALSRDGRKVLDKPLPNDEARLRSLYGKLADHGNLLVVVDQPATIGALAVAVAQDMGITVGYLPGLSMRRIADLTPGSAKTDAKDAAVIAGAARTMPHTLRAVSTSDEDAAALSMLTGFDLDLARQIIREEAPAMRDAVVEDFAIHPEDLKRVATPELLDDIAANVMALRLGDEQFAREIYRDIRDQAIRAAERWYDVAVRVRLSTAVERSTAGTPLLDVTVEWEYTTVPSSATRRFACVSDQDEYNELRQDVPATSTWFMAPRPGMDTRRREAYELLELTVDGRPQPIRRSTRATGQTYSVDLDEDARNGEPVRIRQVFRTITPQWSHRLYFAVRQPTRGWSLRLDYTDTNIGDMRVNDTVATAPAARIVRSPEAVPGKVIALESAGWLMPGSGVAFTWTLNEELPQTEQPEAAASSRER